MEEAYAGFLFQNGGGGFMFVAPYWFLVPLAVAFADVPWTMGWRFTLRALLVATTLVAVVLGLIVWVMS